MENPFDLKAQGDTTVWNYYYISILPNLIYTMPATTLQELLERLPEIKSDRKYWFFRTNGGEYYYPFLKGNFIAINYDKVSLQDISAGNTGNETGVFILAEKVRKAYKDVEKRPSHTASQLLKFVYQIKKGDIVLIPSESSYDIAVGEVKETPTYLRTGSDYDNCPYLKRKKVKWIKTIKRDDLDPNLFKLMYSHHTITEADAYSQYIDKIVNSLYVKNDKAHLILEVQTTDEIKAKHLFEMGVLVLELMDEFCEEENLNINSDSVNVKIDVQSPGAIELAGLTVGAIVIVGLIFVGLAGGGFSFKYKKNDQHGDSSEVEASMTTDGIIEKMKAFLNSKSKRKDADLDRQTKKQLVEKYLKEMQIKDPDDLIKLIKDIEK